MGCQAAVRQGRQPLFLAPKPETQPNRYIRVTAFDDIEFATTNR